jgi:hypothetical protein
MTPHIPRVVVLAAALALLPWPALASLHGDLRPLDAVFTAWLTFLWLGNGALLVAAYLLWRKGQAGWLFVCVALTMAPILLSRLLVMAGVSLAPNFVFVWQLIPLVYWVLLLVAIALKPQSGSAQPAAARRPTRGG